MNLFRLAALALLLSSVLQAAPITWTSTAVSGPAVISTAGMFVGAMNVGRNAAETMNGVTFVADPSGIGVNALGLVATVGVQL